MVASSFGLFLDAGSEIKVNLSFSLNFLKIASGNSSIILRTLLDLGLKFKLIKLFLFEISSNFSLYACMAC